MDVSYDDAAAYCQWAGVRLPTNAEWLAASILDTKIYDDSDEAYQVKRRLGDRDDAMEYGGNDWASTHVKEDRVIRRGGPELVWTSADRRFPPERFAVWTGDNDLLSTFRVCRR